MIDFKMLSKEARSFVGLSPPVKAIEVARKKKLNLILIFIIKI